MAGGRSEHHQGHEIKYSQERCACVLPRVCVCCGSLADHEAQQRAREHKTALDLSDAMSEISLRLLDAEDTAVASEQYLRDVARFFRVEPSDGPSSPTKFRRLPALSAAEKGRSPLRKLFLDLENAADDVGEKFKVGSPEEQRLEVSSCT